MEDLDTEYWKKIQGYNYYVSTEGRVKNKNNYIMKQQIGEDGYYRVTLSNRKKHTFLVSRLVAKAFIPNPNNLPEVHHKNKNKLDNRMCNLMWVTTLENSQSINKTINVGCVTENANGFQSKIVINGNKYQFCNLNEDKCWDWIFARRIELEYGLNLTELDITKFRKRGTGSIKPRTDGRFTAARKKNSITHRETFDTYEDAEKWIETFK